MAYFSAVSSLCMRRKSAALPIAVHFVKRIFKQMTELGVILENEYILEEKAFLDCV